MSKSNPTRAIDALLPPPIKIAGTSEVVRPITLSTYAILERIKSPFLLTPKDGAPEGVLGLLPSLFVLCRGPLEALSGDIEKKAVEWADALPPAIMPVVKAAALRQIEVMTSVIAVPAKAGKKKPVTVGS